MTAEGLKNALSQIDLDSISEEDLKLLNKIAYKLGLEEGEKDFQTEILTKVKYQKKEFESIFKNAMKSKRINH